MSSEQMIFVGGCMRSGTTILQRLLCTSPDTGPMTSECYYLTQQMELHAQSLSSFELRMADYFADPDALGRFTRTTLTRFFTQARLQSGDAGIPVWKNPELTRHFPQLARWFPQARFVVLVRDPRDTVASIIKVGERHRSNGVASGLTQMGRDMRRLANTYKSYYLPVLNSFQQLRSQIVLVRYERLVQEPEAMAAELSAALKIPITPAIAHGGDRSEDVPYFDDARRTKDGFFDAFWSPLYKQGLSASRTGRYREVLSEQEVEKLQEHCADFNRIFRYWEPAPARAPAMSG